MQFANIANISRVRTSGVLISLHPPPPQPKSYHDIAGMCRVCLNQRAILLRIPGYYCLTFMASLMQKYGPDDTVHVPRDLREIDALVGDLIAYYEGERGARVIILSEYGISPVTEPV